MTRRTLVPAMFLVLGGCATEPEPQEPGTEAGKMMVSGERVKKSDVDMSKMTRLEPTEGESQAQMILRVLGLREYGPDMSCEEVMKDLEDRGADIQEIERNSLKVKSPNADTTVTYTFESSTCQ